MRRMAGAGAAAFVGLALLAGVESLHAQSSSGEVVWQASATGGPVAVEARLDRATGYGWELVRGPAGGPGRWLRSAAPAGSGQRTAKPKRGVAAPPVVRAGDRLLVIEETPAATVRMVVVALEPARVGETLRVRPPVGSRVLLAVALGEGRAALAASRWGKE